MHYDCCFLALTLATSSCRTKHKPHPPPVLVAADSPLTLHLATHSAFEREPTMADIFSHLSGTLAG